MDIILSLSNYKNINHFVIQSTLILLQRFSLIYYISSTYRWFDIENHEQCEKLITYVNWREFYSGINNYTTHKMAFSLKQKDGGKMIIKTKHNLPYRYSHRLVLASFWFLSILKMDYQQLDDLHISIMEEPQN